mmetsp:Transcript_106991/g.300977  ORF Transcript_106991/g.300977 Transcript_106991/m.300977 type:complete len:231 (+) Transcript_106991:219-911(+)
MRRRADSRRRHHAKECCTLGLDLREVETKSQRGHQDGPPSDAEQPGDEASGGSKRREGRESGRFARTRHFEARRQQRECLRCDKCAANEQPTAEQALQRPWPHARCERRANTGGEKRGHRDRACSAWRGETLGQVRATSSATDDEHDKGTRADRTPRLQVQKRSESRHDQEAASETQRAAKTARERADAEGGEQTLSAKAGLQRRCIAASCELPGASALPRRGPPTSCAS